MTGDPHRKRARKDSVVPLGRGLLVAQVLPHG